MSRNDTMCSVLTAWFTQRGRTADWSRSINPPGIQLHLEPPGLSVLLHDSAIEDNEPGAVLAALAPAIEHRLAEHIEVTVNAKLTVVVQ